MSQQQTYRGAPFWQHRIARPSSWLNRRRLVKFVFRRARLRWAHERGLLCRQRVRWLQSRSPLRRWCRTPLDWTVIQWCGHFRFRRRRRRCGLFLLRRHAENISAWCVELSTTQLVVDQTVVPKYRTSAMAVTATPMISYISMLKMKTI